MVVDENEGPKLDYTFGTIEMHNDGAVLRQEGDKNDVVDNLFIIHDKGSKASTNVSDSKTKKVLSEGSIGLDSLSTVDLFCDARILTNIRKAPRVMKIQCNAWCKDVTHVGDLDWYVDVCSENNPIANILSLCRKTERIKVTFNCEENEGFLLHLPGGRKGVSRRQPVACTHLNSSAKNRTGLV